MFFSTEPTPYDVHFRLFGIPIRVHPSFWLISILFLYRMASEDLFAAGIVLAILFLSVLCHELAHALMFRRYHIYSSIVIYCFGGFTRPDYNAPGYKQRIAVSLAGPLTNFLIAGITWGSDQIQPWSLSSLHAMIAYVYLLFLNIFLGAFNLLPIWPFDGGQISMELWVRSRPRDGAIQALRTSMLFAGALIVYSILVHFKIIPDLDRFLFGYTPGIFMIMILAMLMYQNYQQLQLLSRQRAYYDDDRPPWR